MKWPTDPADFLALDAEQQADVLLTGLADCPEGERGRNFYEARLSEWFYDLVSGVGNPQTFPRLQQQRHQATEALEDAYSLLETRGLIRPDLNSGTTFCKVTSAGIARLEAGQLVDGARVDFARRALAATELHPALRKRNVAAHFRQGKFETALRDGATFLEDGIRTLGNVDSKLVGVNLVSKAFSDTGSLTDRSVPSGEQAGLQSLYMGFFGRIRNQLAHKDFQYVSHKEAFQTLMLLDYLTEKLGEAAGRLGRQLA